MLPQNGHLIVIMVSFVISLPHFLHFAAIFSSKSSSVASPAIEPGIMWSTRECFRKSASMPEVSPIIMVIFVILLMLFSFAFWTIIAQRSFAIPSSCIHFFLSWLLVATLHYLTFLWAHKEKLTKKCAPWLFSRDFWNLCKLAARGGSNMQRFIPKNRSFISSQNGDS